MGIFGGYAVAFYGAPRFTGDIAIFINTSVENSKRVVKSLNEFGFAESTISADDFLTPDRIIQLGFPPLRIDIITGIDAVSWDTAWKNKTEGKLGDVPVYFISKEDLLRNKKKSGRKKDLADMEALDPEGLSG